MKPHVLLGLLIIFMAFHWSETFAQNEPIKTEVPDSIREKQHSPTKATIMSACLPGLGQIYNKKIWKVPIIYAGFGIMAYFIYTNADEYINFKCAYIESSYGNTAGSYSDLVNKYTKDELLSAREYYRRNLEISCLISALWYGLNILDATVDAHLFTFNISENLTLKIEPSVQPSGINHQPASGLKFSLNF